MYSEFIDKTKINETHITSTGYKTFVEPIYLDSKYDQKQFCARFKKLYNSMVTEIFKMLVDADYMESGDFYKLNSSFQINCSLGKFNDKLGVYKKGSEED